MRDFQVEYTGAKLNVAAKLLMKIKSYGYFILYNKHSLNNDKKCDHRVKGKTFMIRNIFKAV